MGRFGVELLLIAFAAIVVTGFIVTYVEPIDHVQFFYIFMSLILCQIINVYIKSQY